MDLINVTLVETTEAGWRFAVTLTRAGDDYTYTVSLNKVYLEKLFPLSEPEELIKKTMTFLLSREDAASILQEFNVEDVMKFFSDFEDVVVNVR